MESSRRVPRKLTFRQQTIEGHSVCAWPALNSLTRPRPALLTGLAVAAVGLTGASTAGAVVGGTPANRADFPYFTIVSGGCGGALITPNRVLTASHCGEGVQANREVRVGPDGIRRKAVLLAQHPVNLRELTRAGRDGVAVADLLLLQLDRAVPGVTPIPIARPADGLTAPGTVATTIGRGATQASGRGGGAFRSGVVRIQDPASCPDEISSRLDRFWSLCTRDPRLPAPGAPPPFVSACIGDSGGPLIVDRGAGPQLVATVSFGAHCGTQNDPEIYANAVNGRTWALSKRPPWTPAGTTRIEGKRRVGSKLKCVVDWLARPDRDVIFLWTGDSKLRQEGKRSFLRVGEKDRGSRLRCSARGGTAGGYGGTPQSKPVRVAR